MIVHALLDCPEAGLARALSDFEMRFSYPLGPGRSFRISHGEDYPRFVRAMGDARCFVAETDGKVLGVVAVCIRALRTPEGSERQAAYIGDLKVDPSVRGSLTFVRLAQAAYAWARPQVTAGYGVVMDGTRVSPGEYTGRIGIPKFGVLGKILVVRLSTAHDATDQCEIVSDLRGEGVHFGLSRDAYAARGGNPGECSEMEPVWLVHRDVSACGRLEDTSRAKRLIDHDGNEMRNAHLANFASASPRAGAEVIHSARRHGARLGFPALFVSIPFADFAAIEVELGAIDKTLAPATIYGAGLPGDGYWNVSSSEI